MIKKLLLHLIPFLLPFAAFALYILVTKRAAAKGYDWRQSPWYWLTIAGLGFFILSLLFAADIFGGNTTGTYIPAHIEDGKVVPGHFD